MKLVTYIGVLFLPLSWCPFPSSPPLFLPEESDNGLRVHAVATGIIDTYLQRMVQGST